MDARRVRVLLELLLLLFTALLWLSTCADGRKAGGDAAIEPAYRAQIRELARPEQLDKELWQQLTEELDRVLSSFDLSKAVSAPPLDEDSRVTDLQVSGSVAGGATFSFSYRNTGDYDQNGEVNISDLTPVGLYFHLGSGDPQWPAALVADGDSNGEVNIADLTPIGLYYSGLVEGYELQSAASPDSTQWEGVADIPLSGAVPPEDGGWLLLEYFLAAPAGEGYYRVVPFSGAGNERELGIPGVAVFLGENALPPPTNVVASMGSYSDHVALTWTRASGATGYHVYRDAQVTPLAMLGDVSSYNDSSLLDTAPHTYWLRAVDAQRVSNFSAPASGWLGESGDGLEPPASVQAGDGTHSDHISISWSKSPGALSYEVYRDSQSNLIAETGDVAFYNDYNIADSFTHTYWVVALRDADRSAFSISDTGFRGAQPTGTMVVLGYNDLGMHCMNEDFSEMMILPPFNTLHATVIDRSGEEPRLVQSGVTLRYSINGNTYSVGKTNFWEFEQLLLEVELAPNIGLAGNGLAGEMVPSGDGRSDWVALGIPVTPISDAGVENAYPLAHISVLQDGLETAHTQAVVPVSWEISCNLCHNTEGISTATDILRKHDLLHATDLENSKPVMCGSCHAQPPLGTSGQPGVPSLSSAMHTSHSTRMAEANLVNDCYACHPGQRTQCLRDVHFSKGISCSDCHGSMAEVGDPGRQPWSDEPRCDDCHTRAGFEFEQPGTLYRNSVGHRGIQCSACHGSPHAITPTVVSADNLQAIAVQGYPGVISKCSVCHQQPPEEFEHFFEAGDN